MPHVIKLEDQLHGCLQDARIAGAPDLPEAGGCYVAIRRTEVRVVKHVECFPPGMHSQPLVQLDLPGKRNVHIEVSTAAQTFVTSVPVRTDRIDDVKIGIYVLVHQAVRRSSVRPGGVNIGTIVADPGKRIVFATYRVYRQSTLVPHQGRDSPVAEELGQQAAASKVT